MNATELKKWFELLDILKKSNSMTEIHQCCKEMVALKDGFKVVLVPISPNDVVGTISVYKETEDREKLLNTLETTLKQL